MTLTGLDFSGRMFSPTDLRLVQETVHDFPNLSLTELSKTLCELLEWKRPSGKLKREECRALLEHLQAAGILFLPKLRSSLRAVPCKARRKSLFPLPIYLFPRLFWRPDIMLAGLRWCHHKDRTDRYRTRASCSSASAAR